MKKDAIANMAAVDKLPAPWRPLVAEFGLSIVIALWNDGARNAQVAQRDLETWRERRQEQWLGEIPYPRLSSGPRHGPTVSPTD